MVYGVHFRFSISLLTQSIRFSRDEFTSLWSGCVVESQSVETLPFLNSPALIFFSFSDFSLINNLKKIEQINNWL